MDINTTSNTAMNKHITTRSIFTYVFALMACAMATGCATVYTVDDGSEVDEKLLTSIQQYGKGVQTLRPAIVRSAALKDEDCSKQWELPFVVATSYGLPHMEKIAWARGLRVDERLTVVAAAYGSGLKPGDKIEQIDGDDDDPDEMLEELFELRDDGDNFELTLSDGRIVKVQPVEVCRGRVELTTPAAPDAQNYHWLQSAHPMSIFNQELTDDEAVWIVLWTQGLSEEAGARMKTYHYGMNLVKTAMTTASIVSGVGAAAGAAQAAATSIATSEAGKMAAQAAGKEVAKFAAEQVADSVRKKMVEAALKEAGKAAAQEVAVTAVASAGLFKSSLSGVSWVAGTGFWMADKWALDRMEKVGADPVAAYTLHQKLASAGQADNAFVFDEERLANMGKYAEERGFSDRSKYALSGTTSETSAVVAGDLEMRPLDSPSPEAIVAADGTTTNTAENPKQPSADVLIAEAAGDKKAGAPSGTADIAPGDPALPVSPADPAPAVQQ